MDSSSENKNVEKVISHPLEQVEEKVKVVDAPINEKKKKVKNPKRVEAGKKLVAWNRENKKQIKQTTPVNSTQSAPDQKLEPKKWILFSGLIIATGTLGFIYFIQRGKYMENEKIETVDAVSNQKSSEPDPFKMD